MSPLPPIASSTATESIQIGTPHFSKESQVEQYANNSTYQWDGAMKIFQLFKFNGSEEILDVGCGDGKVTKHLFGLTHNRICGIDISPQMIEKAQTTHSGIDFKVGDMTTYVDENPYDVIYAGYALHYGDAETTLSCMYNNLKPGGTALITLPGKYEGSLAANADRLSQTEKWAEEFAGFKSIRKYYNTEEFSKLLQTVGLIPNHVKSIVQQVKFPDKNAIEAYYLPVSAHARHLPEHLRAEFISDLISQVLSNNGTKTENSFIYQNKLEIMTTKPNT